MAIPVKNPLEASSLVWSMLIFLLGLPFIASSAEDLDTHLWRHRLLFVIAPTATDSVVVKQLVMLNKRADALIDRDIRVFQLYMRGASLYQDIPLTFDEAVRLRTELRIHPDARILLLIGKDGTIKRRAPIDTDLRDIFAQIDGMPMRRNEIRRKNRAGFPVTDL